MSDTDHPQAEPMPGRAEPAREAEPVAGPELLTTTDTVTIHRSPRYYRFMIAGAIAGVIVALILTFAFPEPPGFNLAQIFGFLGILFVIIGVVVGSAVALIIDLVARRRARTIQVERTETIEPTE